MYMTEKSVESANAESNATGAESLDDVLRRHGEERRDLQKRRDRIISRIPRKDRTGRARAAEEFAVEEQMLNTRINAELDQLRASGILKAEEALPDVIPKNDETQDLTESCNRAATRDIGLQSKESRAARRRRAKLEAENEKEQRIAFEKAEMGPSERVLEIRAIDDKLKPLSLAIHDIPPDGHCLYAAVAHQLRLTGHLLLDENTDVKEQVPSRVEHDVWHLRMVTANHMRSHRQDYIPFLETVDFRDDKFEEYCERLQSEAVWGGQVELRALATCLNVVIEVYSASMPLLIMGECEAGEESKHLRLSFHTSYYDLGDHYNSVVPQKAADVES